MNNVDHDFDSPCKEESGLYEENRFYDVNQDGTGIEHTVEKEIEDSSSMVPAPLALRSQKRYMDSPAKSLTSFKPLPSPARSVSSIVSPRSSMAGQRQLLERFCSKLRNDGMEALKLNSEKIWQVRYLTVSKEVSWLKTENDDDAGDRGHCPKGLLWIKKITSSREQSVNNIDRHGKGGILFSHILSVEELTGKNIPMSKKQLQGKFIDSVVVVLKGTEEAGSKTVYFRCRTRQEALVLCAGCSMIVKMLMKDSQPAAIKAVTPVSADKPKHEIGPNDDLWEV